MAKKFGKHKAKYDNYKNSGRKFINKEEKQKRAKKREEKFIKRREEGKTYEYKPNPYKKGTVYHYFVNKKRQAKNVSKKTPYARNTSIMRKLQNSLNAIAEADKKKCGKKKGDNQ